MILLHWRGYILCIVSDLPVPDSRRYLYLIKNDFRNVKFRIPLPWKGGPVKK